MHLAEIAAAKTTHNQVFFAFAALLFSLISSMCCLVLAGRYFAGVEHGRVSMHEADEDS